METGIFNLTQHPATPDQSNDGVLDPVGGLKEKIQQLLTFEEIPESWKELEDRAEKLAQIALDSGCKRVMLGGAPFFMSRLEKALIRKELRPVYSFSRREVTETMTFDGVVEKKALFKHIGWV